MKTLYYSLLAFLSIGFTTSSAIAGTPPYPPSVLMEIHDLNEEGDCFLGLKIHYVRGHKNDQGQCQDRGICEFDIEIGIRAVSPGGLNGEMKKDRYGNILLVIEKSGMTAEDPIDITGFAEGPGTLQLSNNSEIPTEVKTELGLLGKYQLKAGNYQVTETATTYIVNFRK